MKFATHILLSILVSALLMACEGEDSDPTEDFFYLKNKGANMPVWVEGNPAAKKIIILLHGGPGGNAVIYNTGVTAFSDPLEEDYLMVYYDQRGSGAASGNYSKDDLTIAQHVEDLDKLITLLEHKYGSDNQIYLMGHSWGGMLGSAYLLEGDNQQRISGWIEVDGAHTFQMEAEIARRLIETGTDQINSNNSRRQWEDIVEYCEDLDTNNVSDQEQIRLNNYGHRVENYLIQADLIDTRNAGEALVDAYNYTFESGNNYVGSFYNQMFTASGLGMFDEIKNINYTNQLSTITIPCLFAWGRHDYVVPWRFGQEAFNAVSSTRKRLVIFEFSGHSPMINEPDEFNAVVKSFVNDN